MAQGLEKILSVHQQVIDEGYTRTTGPNFKSYAVTNLRGGVGKSFIAFNLAYEVSRKHSVLLADLCPQCHFTTLLLGDYRPKVNIYDALQPITVGAPWGDIPDDISYRVSQYCDEFKGGKGAWAIAGNPELSAFPSTLYQQLNSAYAARDHAVVQKLLHGLKAVLGKEADEKKCDKILLDTSPFYAGGTHLSWCAVEALIVPVRVDEHSIESLELLFRQLSDATRDFCQWNERAGGCPTPKVAAIVMTMVGSHSQGRAAPDSASRVYVERAFNIVQKHAQLLAVPDPSDAFVLTDDFHSAGRISSAKRIPISELKIRSFHRVENRRVQVNASAERYQKQLKYLASMI